MFNKIAALLSSILLTFVGVSPVFADELPPEPTASPKIVINEIYPNAPGSSESGVEFIELFNQSSEIVDLTGFSLRRLGTSTIKSLDGQILDAGEYLIIYPNFSLLNSGSTIYLDYPPDENNEVLSIETTYPSLDEEHSWSLVGDIWQAEEPTPGEPNPTPPEEDPVVAEPEVIEEVFCDFSTVYINEVVANPAGADTNGGEFVELYNGGTQSVSLEGCLLTTDKVSNMALPAVELPSNGYYVIELSDDLLNAGGSVKFITLNDEYDVTYPSLGDDESWSIINGVWQVTKVQTPGAQNQPTPENTEVKGASTEEELEPCPEGKYRNPETNRCKNIADTAVSLLPCGPGETRNLATNRCRKNSSLSSALTPCKPGQERNPATNRCRNIAAVSGKAITPCQPGYERNPNTNRCRKISGSVASANFTKTEPSKIHNGVLIFVSLLALGYGVFEYRFDFANWYAKLRTKFAKT